MSTMTQAPKQRKRSNPQPVHGVAAWMGGTPNQATLDVGEALLQIAVAGKEPAFYWVEALKDADGFPVGYRLTKIDAPDKPYDVDATSEPWKCDCPDAVYCDRPGGCKHVRALRAALTAAGLIGKPVNAA